MAILVMFVCYNSTILSGEKGADIHVFNDIQLRMCYINENCVVFTKNYKLYQIT